MDIGIHRGEVGVNNYNQESPIKSPSPHSSPRWGEEVYGKNFFEEEFFNSSAVPNFNPCLPNQKVACGAVEKVKNLSLNGARSLKNCVKYGNEILPLHFIQGQNDSVGRFFNSPPVPFLSGKTQRDSVFQSAPK